MSNPDWTDIPGRIESAGFSVCYGRISYDPDRPLWSAKACRDGREWSTLGESLGAAFLELEKHTREADKDWRALIVHEIQIEGSAAGGAKKME